MDPTADMTPVAKGDLVKTPLAHLVVFIAERKLQGSLLLHGDDGSTSTVYFATGAPAKVQTSYPGTNLGRVLLQLGFIDDDVLARSSAERDQVDSLHGQILVAMGAIDQGQLVAGLREQMMRRLLKMFEKLGELTTYAFYADTNLLSDWGGPEVTPIDPYRILWEGIHLRPNDPSIEPTLARLGSVPVGVNSKADLRRFGFGPPEHKVIELLAVRPMSLAQVLELSVMPIRQLKLLMYVLLITKSILVVPVQTSAPATRPRPPTDPKAQALPPRPRAASTPEAGPSSSSGVPMARVKLKKSAAPVKSVAPAATQYTGPSREEIIARAETIESEDYFQSLGVGREDPPDVVRSAYFSFAKLWHPDRLPPDLADVRDEAGKVFARITDAFQILSDAEKRAQYIEALEKGVSNEDEQAKVQKVIEATIEYQKAEVFLRKRDYDKALKSARRAYEGDPEQAHHIALYAWILAQQPEAQQNRDFEEPVALLNQAIKLHDRCEQAFLYRAMLFKLMGEPRAALKDFRTVVDINPKNIEATREVRLATMRGGVASVEPKETKAAKGGAEASINWSKDSVGDIFGKLFKKK